MTENPITQLTRMVDQQVAMMTANLTNVLTLGAQLVTLPLQAVNSVAEGSGIFSQTWSTDQLNRSNIYGA